MTVQIRTQSSPLQFQSKCTLIINPYEWNVGVCDACWMQNASEISLEETFLFL